ncbi:MAG TPA: glucoamylase family protein [Candidatus Omnitrophota bacterium]|nr:glucoamylase family protein [Candidatus Omnitrophota bacterium]HPS36524.1 glucoamylase family protein [Candidatus Omnitrophota bacterium]
MLKRLACLLSVLFLWISSSCAPSLAAFEPAPEDTELLNKIEQDTLQYFVRLSDKTTGLTKDSSRPGSPSSIAATGFSLAALAIGGSRGWIPQDFAQARILATLKVLRNKAAQQEGFFYHFIDPRTGNRVWSSEASSIDTALVVAGGLLAAQYYPGTEIETLAREIYERVNWKWMMNGSDFICMGWTPESKFFPYYWDSYNELMILVALAVGSPTHPAPPKTWERWLRPRGEFNGHSIIYASTGSLFTYQFSHAYIDFRGLEDGGTDYFENSRDATLANRDYSMSFASKYKGYSPTSWGLSASVGPGGYKAYGGKPGGGLQDGTVAPYAALSSIVFTPDLSTQAARFFYENYQKELYGNFGFKDAFNLDKNWWANEYLGIDQGITLLMLENYLNDEAVWKKFMQLEPVRKWLELTGLKKRPAPQASAKI